MSDALRSLESMMRPHAIAIVGASERGPGAALSRNPATEGLSLDEAWSKKLHDSVVQAEVKVSAVMDRKGLTLEDVARFEVGQVIQLDASPTSLIKLECESRALFWCNFGQKEGFYTVRVEECVNETEEFLQDIIGG